VDASVICRVRSGFLLVQRVDPVESPRLRPPSVVEYNSRKQGHRHLKLSSASTKDPGSKAIGTSTAVFLEALKHFVRVTAPNWDEIVIHPDSIRTWHVAKFIALAGLHCTFGRESLRKQGSLCSRGACPRAIGSTKRRYDFGGGVARHQGPTEAPPFT